MTSLNDFIRQARYLCLAADCAEKSNNAKVQESKILYKMASIIYQNVAEQVSDKNPEISYSKPHKRFSELLNQLDVLTNPEKYLGPNYQDVLNFWIYLDTLSDLEKREIVNRYWDLELNVRKSAIDAADNAADDVVGRKFRNESWCAVVDVTGFQVFCYATWELIGNVKNKVFYDLIMSHKKS